MSLFSATDLLVGRLVSSLSHETLTTACYDLQISIPRFARTKSDLSLLLVRSLVARSVFLQSSGLDDLAVSATLKEEYDYVFDVCMSAQPLTLDLPDHRRQRRMLERTNAAVNFADEIRSIQSSWPTVVPKEHALSCCVAYYNATKYVTPDTCASCSRQKLGIQMHEHKIPRSVTPLPLWLRVLGLPDSDIRWARDFSHPNPALNMKMLNFSAVWFDDTDGTPGDVVRLCHDCHLVLAARDVPVIPRLSLRNNLYRGAVPTILAQLTWIEEMVISIFRTTAHVTRLYRTSGPTDPFVLHGNTCAFDMNIVSTATVLPRTVANVLGQLSVVFVGPGRPTESQLKLLFHIRKDFVWEALVCLQKINHLYAAIPISRAILDQYPTDGTLPGLSEAVIVDNELDPRAAFNEETAGFDLHPATYVSATGLDGDDMPYIEPMGVSDPEGVNIPGRTYTAAALRDLSGVNTSAVAGAPNLILARGNTPVGDYNNPDLFPGMFPTLYPFGVGGFEDPKRPVSVSFQKQSEYYLDLADRSFRYHRYFMFVALNIIQRRAAHLHTYFLVKKPYFYDIAQRLVSLSPELINSVAAHLEHEGRVADLSAEQQEVLNLLKKINTISSHVPGSQASKLSNRNELRAYMGYFNIAQIFLTLNLNAVNSPIFQVMFGDTSVDLGTRFPQLAPSSERARRLAQDPVAAADFFQFCIECFLAHMLAWDFESQMSKPGGGILGTLRAFYGSCEYYERGGLHGHFTIWLLGGLNPSDVHERMRSSPEFQARFFAFFEDIIKHHLPDVEIAPEPNYQPRAQRPPLPPSGRWDAEWDILFHTEWKLVGEILQRHTCRDVCHKYGHIESCRFLFPHPTVKESWFDAETNSIILLCLDENVNYHNPFILIFCRHNHDIKCILSGKSAKAAMFYITDYITKMDMSLHEIVSLMSRTVAAMPTSLDGQQSLVEKARSLLHKCLSQFSKQQQIHAQQAVRYIRALGDTISSHKTVPMLSSALLLSARQQIAHIDSRLPSSSSMEVEGQEEEVEHPSLRIVLSSDGSLNDMNQIDDYLCRGNSLSDMCFYDFVRAVVKEPIPSTPLKGTLRANPRHVLLPPHKQCNTHQLMQRSDPSVLVFANEFVPRVLGCSIPRRDAEVYSLFALAHFKPWSHQMALVSPGNSLSSEFETYSFLERHCDIMKNWEDLYECQDERDADRMRKHNQQVQESHVQTRSVFESADDLDAALALLGSSNVAHRMLAKQDREALEIMEKLRASNWFKSPLPIASTLSTQNSLLVDSAQLKAWNKIRKRLEEDIKISRRRALNPNDAVVTEADVPETLTGQASLQLQPPAPTQTSVPIPVVSDNATDDDVIQQVAVEHNLNEQQLVAFQIAARHFFSILRCIRQAGKDTPVLPAPLRMVMTGPGGTGKTHVVKALQSLMALYGCSHYIRYLAPTGSAASLIDGMTIHSGLGISIKRRNQGHSSRAAGEDKEDWTVVLDAKHAEELRAEWRNVHFLLVDEFSMVGCELLCDLDQALQFVKELRIWFGGICMFFGGDPFQFPPVGAHPLHTPITTTYFTKADDVRRRLGRLAWKQIDTVVILTKQVRMAEDPEYGAAVLRLRERVCTAEDVALFNSRVIKSDRNPHGVDMGLQDNSTASMIVATNAVRIALNNGKSQANTMGPGMPSLIRSAAWDTCSNETLTPDIRKYLLNLNFAGAKLDKPLPGYIPLYVGMPVILRDRNISTELKITNGSQGVVHRLVSEKRETVTVVTCAIVHFPLSKILLPGLLEGEFPIVPLSWTFRHSYHFPDGRTVKLQIKRQQLPIQPSFAITGHSAQGKTLKKIMVDLRDGGFAAYVAASRPTTRRGLCITDPVTLDDLNKPLPATLTAEHKRLKALAYNTLIRHGIKAGNLIEVPDPEYERSMDLSSIQTTLPFEIVKKNPQLSPHTNNMHECDPKTTRPGCEKVSTSSDQQGAHFQQAKVRVEANNLQNSLDYMLGLWDTPSVSLVVQGPIWDSQNWSCAYDAVFVALYAAFKYDSPDWAVRFQSLSPTAQYLLNNAFSEQLAFSSHSASAVSNVRNSFRDHLTSLESQRFVRSGTVLCNVDDILEVVTGGAIHNLKVRHTFACGNAGCAQHISIRHSYRAVTLPSVWSTYAAQIGLSPSASTASLATWFKLLMSPQLTQLPAGDSCPSCMSLLHLDSSIFEYLPPLLWIETVPGVFPRALASSTIMAPSETGQIEYKLRAIIYFGHAHFALRYFDNQAQAWFYDGMLNGAKPTFDSSVRLTNSPVDISALSDGKAASFYLYTMS